MRIVVHMLLQRTCASTVFLTSSGSYPTYARTTCPFLSSTKQLSFLWYVRERVMRRFVAAAYAQRCAFTNSLPESGCTSVHGKGDLALMASRLAFVAS